MPADESDDDEWRFSVDEFDDPEEVEETSEWDDDFEAIDGVERIDDEQGGKAGSDEEPSPFLTDEPLESGDVNPENAFFVLVGIMLVLVSILVLFGAL
jgi:hypothetical protein